MKKIITAAIVLLSITVSCFSAFAAYQTDMPQDIDDSEYKAAIEMCVMLNIMDISESMEFEGKTNVTRADLARIVMGMLNMKGLVTSAGTVDLETANGQDISDEWMGSSISGVKKAIQTPIFDDVPFDHENYVAIQFVADLGYMRGFGDGTFHPDDSVVFRDIIKVLVSLLGYERYAQDNGGYPDGYMYQAAKLDITKYLVLPQSSPVNKEQAAALICAALEADICNVENEVQYGKTLLTERFKVRKDTGIVAAVPKTGLYSAESEASDVTVKIGSNIYINNGIISEDMLGKRVTVYYDDNDGEGSLIYVVEREQDNDEKSFLYNDFDGYSNGRLKYFEGSKSTSKTAKISESAPVIVNGVYDDILKNIDFGEFADYPTDFRILDSNGDGTYDVLFINFYKTYIVRNVNTIENRIFVSDVTDTDSSAAVVTNNSKTRYLPIDFDEPGVEYRFFKDGSQVAMSGIRTDSIISVAESRNISGVKYVDIYISQTKVSGRVQSITDDTITINDTEYRLVPHANLSELKGGYAGTLYLDINNNVAAYGVDSGEYDYGVLMKCAISDDGESAVFKIFRKNTGKTEFLDAADKVKIGEKSYKPLEAVKVLGGNAMPQQLVAYKVNAEGKLREIMLATVYNNWNYSGDYEEKGSDITINRMDMGVLSTYTDASGNMGPGVRMDRRCFRLFFSDFIPADDITIFDLSSPDTSKWAVKTGTSNLSHNRVYDCAAYNVSYCNIASIMVIFPSESTDTRVKDVDYYDKDCVIVSDVLDAVDEDGNVVKQITGFVMGKQIVYTIDYNENKEKADQFHKGDVWQIDADSTNRITAATEILNGNQDFSNIKTIRKTLLGKTQIYESTVGIVKEAAPNAMVIGVDENTSNSDSYYITPGESSESSSAKHKLWITKIGVYGAGSTNLYWYNVHDKTVEVMSTNDLEPNDLVFVSSDYGATRQILVIKDYN